MTSRCCNHSWEHCERSSRVLRTDEVRKEETAYGLRRRGLTRHGTLGTRIESHSGPRLLIPRHTHGPAPTERSACHIYPPNTANLPGKCPLRVRFARCRERIFLPVGQSERGLSPSVGEGLGTPRAPGGTDPTAAPQDQLRTLRWDDLMGDLRAKSHGASVPAELERLRVACTVKTSVNMRT